MPQDPTTDPNTPHLQDIASTADHSLMQGQKHLEATQNLETPLEGILLKADEIAKNTKAMADKPPLVQNIQIQPNENESELATVLWSMLRGPKGEPGENAIPPPPPTKEELTALIHPLIPAPVKGEPGATPTKEEITALITPLIPQPVPGKNAEPPDDNYLISLIRPHIPPPLKGEPGLDGRLMTGEEMVSKLESMKKGRLNYEKLDNLPDLTALQRGVASKDYALADLTDVNLAGLLPGQVLIFNGTTFTPVTVVGLSGGTISQATLFTYFV